MVKDKLGNVFEIGDQLAYASSGRGIVVGEVVKIVETRSKCHWNKGQIIGRINIKKSHRYYKDKIVTISLHNPTSTLNISKINK